MYRFMYYNKYKGKKYYGCPGIAWAKSYFIYLIVLKVK